MFENVPEIVNPGSPVTPPHVSVVPEKKYGPPLVNENVPLPVVAPAIVTVLAGTSIVKVNVCDAENVIGCENTWLSEVSNSSSASLTIQIPPLVPPITGPQNSEWNVE